MDTNLSAWIELSLWRSKRCHEHSMVKFESMRLSSTPYMRVHYWTSVSLEGCTSANFSHYILSWYRDEGFVSNRSKDVSHEIYSCTMELPNECASFVVIFVLFCFFHLGRLCDLCLAKNAGKSFIHRTKIYCLVTTSYELFNGLQAFLFFLLSGIKVGIERKQILHPWVADQSTAFLFTHGSHLNV